MAELGTYSIPKEYKDEDKWFRFFTKKQLLHVGVGCGIGLMLFAFMTSIGISALGIALAEICIIISAIVAFIKMPTEKYLVGGGYNLSTIIYRLILKRLPRNKVIYIKNYNSGKLEV